MSVFSEQNTRLAQGIANAKVAIEAKKGAVSVANTSPQIEEIVAGINSIPTGTVGPGGSVLHIPEPWDNYDIRNSLGCLDDQIVSLSLTQTKTVSYSPLILSDTVINQLNP